MRKNHRPRPGGEKFGVYGLRSVSTGRCYVGSTNSLWQRRICHFGKLRNGVHFCRNLQAIYNERGEDDIEFVLFEERRIPDDAHRYGGMEKCGPFMVFKSILEVSWCEALEIVSPGCLLNKRISPLIRYDLQKVRPDPRIIKWLRTWPGPLLGIADDTPSPQG